MVSVIDLKTEWPRKGYHVHEGLIVDLPSGDGRDKIVENEDGSVTLADPSGKVSVTVKDVVLDNRSELFVKMNWNRDGNHVMLDDVHVADGKSTVICEEGSNVISDVLLTGQNHMDMNGNMIEKSSIHNSDILNSAVSNSPYIENSGLSNGASVDNSGVTNCQLIGTTVTNGSHVELSRLGFDTLDGTTVIGVSSEKNAILASGRTFKSGIYVGDGTPTGSYAVTSGEDIEQGLADLIVTDKVPVMSVYYEPREGLLNAIADRWDDVPADKQAELKERMPFLEKVEEKAFLKEIGAIDPSQFEVKESQNGLQF